jgi:hypothetical protein
METEMVKHYAEGADALLNERNTTHGRFIDNARNGQALRDLFRQSPHWAEMDPVQREALDMIACKVSRILSGQSGFRDHWADCQGYSQLVLDHIDGRAPR